MSGGLKPCPFCGQPAEPWPEPPKGALQAVGCRNAGCIMAYASGETLAYAAIRWNTRTPDNLTVNDRGER